MTRRIPSILNRSSYFNSASNLRTINFYINDFIDNRLSDGHTFEMCVMLSAEKRVYRRISWDETLDRFLNINISNAEDWFDNEIPFEARERLTAIVAYMVESDMRIEYEKLDDRSLYMYETMCRVVCGDDHNA